MFNYNHLYYFYIMAREGRVAKAAAVLNISQPSLSSQLKTLEQSLGRALFVKVGRKLELSREGQSAYAYCQQMFDVSHRFAGSLSLAPRLDHSQLRIAVADEIERPFGATYISDLLRRLGDRDRSVRMVSDRHSQLIDDLSKNRFDLMLSNYSVDEREFRTIAQAKMPVFAIASRRGRRKGPLTKKGFIAELKRTRPALVLPANEQKLRIEVNHFLDQQSLNLPVVFESNVLAAVSRTINEGLGIGFLPLSYIGRELKLNQLVQMCRTPLWYHGLNLICKSTLQDEAFVSSAKASFATLMRQTSIALGPL